MALNMVGSIRNMVVQPIRAGLMFLALIASAGASQAGVNAGNSNLSATVDAAAPRQKLAQRPVRPRRPNVRRPRVRKEIRRATRRARVRRRARRWRGRHWGRVAFGVTLGTIIAVAANTPPVPPDPSLCWTWENDALTQGYWYYCDGD